MDMGLIQRRTDMQTNGSTSSEATNATAKIDAAIRAQQERIANMETLRDTFLFACLDTAFAGNAEALAHNRHLLTGASMAVDCATDTLRAMGELREGFVKTVEALTRTIGELKQLRREIWKGGR
jgi:hypothetical protein